MNPLKKSSRKSYGRSCGGFAHPLAPPSAASKSSTRRNLTAEEPTSVRTSSHFFVGEECQSNRASLSGAVVLASSVAHLFTGTRGIIRRGRRKKIVARTRSTIRGTTRLLPARKPRQPAPAVSRAFDRGASLTRRVRASGNRSTRGVRTTPGLRQVTVTPVSATSAASAAENDCT
jgi:hypothetical protein